MFSCLQASMSRCLHVSMSPYFHVSVFPCFHFSIFPFFHISIFPCFRFSMFLWSAGISLGIPRNFAQGIPRMYKLIPKRIPRNSSNPLPWTPYFPVYSISVLPKQSVKIGKFGKLDRYRTSVIFHTVATCMRYLQVPWRIRSLVTVRLRYASA
jgi:hypothetical protein